MDQIVQKGEVTESSIRKYCSELAQYSISKEEEGRHVNEND